MVVLGRVATAGTRVATAGTHNKLLNLVYQLSLVNLLCDCLVCGTCLRTCGSSDVNLWNLWFPCVCGSLVLGNFGCENI